MLMIQFDFLSKAGCIVVGVPMKAGHRLYLRPIQLKKKKKKMTTMTVVVFVVVVVVVVAVVVHRHLLFALL